MLLLIDSSGETASVILAQDGRLLGRLQNKVARDHSAWLHPAISELISSAGATFSSIRAVAIMAGPGSYTGLRVGMAAAKGICYALKIPLISCNNLAVMAAAMARQDGPAGQLLCPMIDARRMEVFTAIYTQELKLIRSPQALILDKTSFENELAAGPVLFGGDGSVKWSEICSSPMASFFSQPDAGESFIAIATTRFNLSQWTDTVYSEPEYGKEFHTHEIK